MQSKIKIWLFGAYAVILLGVLVKIIYDQNQIFNQGTSYKFECVPVDPNDPFRGKYVRLGFELIKVDHPNKKALNPPVYGKVEVNKEGFAFISEVDTLFSEGVVSIELIPDQINETISYYKLPFDRLYMNEDKAPKAEELYRSLVLDKKTKVYANVFISEKRYLLDDVYADEVALRDLIE